MAFLLNLLTPRIPCWLRPLRGFNEARRELNSWLRGESPHVPRPFIIQIEPQGKIISSVLGRITILNAEGLKGRYQIRFSDYQGRKQAHLLDMEGNIVRNCAIRLNGENFNLDKINIGTLQTETFDHRKSIRKWLIENEKIPGERYHEIFKGGALHSVTINGKTINLTALGLRKREAIARFKETNEEKRVAVYEMDGKTLIREFRFVQDERGVWEAEPVEMSNMQQARAHGESIRKWLMENGQVPDEQKDWIRSGNLYLVSINENIIKLSALGALKREAIVKYYEAEGEKRAAVYEIDGETLAREFRLIKDENEIWEAEPMEKSSRQKSKAHGDSIRRWLVENGQIPEEQKVKRQISGSRYLLEIDGNPIILNALGNKGEFILKFREIEDEKRVAAFEMDRETLVREFRFIQDEHGVWKAEPVAMNSRQQSNAHGESIRKWLMENGQVPEEQKDWIRSGNLYLVSINEKKKK